MIEAVSKNPQQTFNLGKDLSQNLKAGDVVAFYGDLGAGKTHFIKGVCSGLHVKETVVSPSFSIVNEYTGDYKVYHIDFYRLEKSNEIMDLGIEEYLYDDGICLIEWAGRIESFLPEKRINVEIELFDENKNRRRIRISN